MMKAFQDYNPAAVTVWFACTAGTAMFISHPAVSALTLVCSVILYFTLSGTENLKSHAGYPALFAVLALVNPLVSHNGRTVLFFLNRNPVTLEALLYGINASAVITGVLYLFRSLSVIMTSDRILYLTSFLSPKTSLVISMALRYIPLFRRQTRRISDAQKCLGLFREDSIPDTIKGNARIFSVLVSWALENGIITAESMKARGFGSGKRTCLKQYRFGRGDAVLTIVMLLLAVPLPLAYATGKISCSFYPAVKINVSGPEAAAGIISYALLALVPVITEIKVRIRWKLLMSKI